MNILHLTPDFNYSDGRSYYVYLILKYLKKTGHNVFLCTNKGNSFDRIFDLGISAIVNPSLSNKSSFLKSLKFISNFAEENDIEIVHSHHRYYELLANSIHGKRKLHTVFTALSIVDKKFFIEYKSDKIIAVSNCVKDMLINKFGVKKSKISLIPNFVDSEELKCETLKVKRETSILKRETSNVNRESSNVNRESSNVEKVYILSVGRFHREKNYETLIKAIALIKDYKIRLLLVGDGDERIKIEKIILENSVDAGIFYPQRDLNQFFEIADICVLSSIRDPLPGFMLQSGLHKKPFIGSNVDGISEVIKNGENGLLFEKKNTEQLSGKIRLFIEEKSLALKCADNLNKLITEKYTEKSVMPDIIKLYNEFFETPEKQNKPKT